MSYFNLLSKEEIDVRKIEKFVSFSSFLQLNKVIQISINKAKNLAKLHIEDFKSSYFRENEKDLTF